MTSTQESQPQAQPASRSSYWAWKPAPWILAGLAVLVAVVWVGAELTGPSGSKPNGDPRPACRGFVKERLKAPSTAQFSGMGYSGSDPFYTVTGTVDSQNGFGAMIRNTFTCKVTLQDGTWVLTDLTGLKN